MSDKIVIGLTGNIATGKSMVLRMLQELGATVIDADKLVHQLMRRGGSVYNAIVEQFGRFILDDNEQISRAKLGRIVFSDPEALARLEALTHPGVIEAVFKQIDTAPTPVVAVEAIKLYESGLADHCTSVWAVVAAPKVQMARLVNRRRMKPEQARQRIAAQSSQQEKAARANVVIDNSGALAKTWAVVKKEYTKLLESHTVAVPDAQEPAAPANPLQTIDISSVTLHRAKRNDLPGMAELIASGTHGAFNPDVSEMMEALFSRAYLVARAGDKVVGMVGWQTENLVAGLQDFYVLRDDLWPEIGRQMLEMVHEEIDKLSCEVSLVFVLNKAGHTAIDFLRKMGYEQIDRNRLIPDWREAAEEWQPEDSVLLYKKIREQRIMVPM
ncbi:MAG: dephospho-CoA kinase [Chloroflexi bacterium]|nr:MAG: dephospho-CoA kinase [Chloroflexota bacterium]